MKEKKLEWNLLGDCAVGITCANLEELREAVNQYWEFATKEWDSTTQVCNSVEQFQHAEVYGSNLDYMYRDLSDKWRMMCNFNKDTRLVCQVLDKKGKWERTIICEPNREKVLEWIDKQFSNSYNIQMLGINALRKIRTCVGIFYCNF